MIYIYISYIYDIYIYIYDIYIYDIYIYDIYIYTYIYAHTAIVQRGLIMVHILVWAPGTLLSCRG